MPPKISQNVFFSYVRHSLNEALSELSRLREPRVEDEKLRKLLSDPSLVFERRHLQYLTNPDERSPYALYCHLFVAATCLKHVLSDETYYDRSNFVYVVAKLNHFLRSTKEKITRSTVYEL